MFKVQPPVSERAKLCASHTPMIENLSTHGAAFVTVHELATYWDVSRRQVYKHIETGTLRAMRLGLRCYRIPTRAAIEFERQMSTYGSATAIRPAHRLCAVPVSIHQDVRRA